jgi:hypothetical protein
MNTLWFDKELQISYKCFTNYDKVDTCYYLHKLMLLHEHKYDSIENNFFQVLM